MQSAAQSAREQFANVVDRIPEQDLYEIQKSYEQKYQSAPVNSAMESYYRAIRDLAQQRLLNR